MSTAVPITEPVARHITPREFALVSLRDCPWRDGLPAIKTSDDAVAYFWAHCAQPPGFESHLESLFALLLDKSGNILGHYLVAKGTLGEVVFSYSQFLLPVILASAPDVVLVHNHPGGDITPSGPDIRHASRVQLACELLGITLQDFIIVGLPSRAGGAGFSSLRELGHLNKVDVAALQPAPEEARPAVPALDLDIIPIDETDLRFSVHLAAAKSEQTVPEYLQKFLLGQLRLGAVQPAVSQTTVTP